MCEAYTLTLSPPFKQSVQQGIDFIQACRNPGLAWRYGVRTGENDTAVSGWMLMALESARAAGLRVAPAAFDGMRAWLDGVTDPGTGRVGTPPGASPPYRSPETLSRFPAVLSESLTAVGVLCRRLLDERPAESSAYRLGGERCGRCLPVWDIEAGSIDMHYRVLGSMAMFRAGAEAWGGWRTALVKAFLGTQRKDGDYRGSWDPVGAWGGVGGRVYSTAMMLLSAEVYHHHRHVLGTGARGR